MAEEMIDGHPLEYGLTLEELRDLMELRKGEAYETIQTKYNGVLEMCKKLYTSSNEGMLLTVLYAKSSSQKKLNTHT